MVTCKKCGGLVDGRLRKCPTCGADMKEQKAVSAKAQAGSGAKKAADSRKTASGKNTKQEEYKRPEDSFEEKAKKAWTKFNDTDDSTYAYSEADISGNKGMAILCYISWLVIIPILTSRESPFVRFHINQGISLFILDVVCTLLFRALGFMFLLTPFDFVIELADLAVSALILAMAITGIVNVCKGKAKEMPLVGKIRYFR